MSSGQKVAVSLLVSVLIFSAIAVAAFAGLFSVVEARFYQPLVVKTLEQRLQTVAEKQSEYSTTLSQRFSAFAADKNVASYALSQPTSDQQKARTDKTGALFAETPALRGIRIIDTNGRSVHYSSFDSDIKLRAKNQISYKNYPDFQDIPFAVLACANSRNAEDTSKILFDQEKNRVIYAYPFYDVATAYRGTIAFYCDADDINRFLVAQGTVTLNDAATLVALPLTQEDTAQLGGYVFGMPQVGQDLLKTALLEKIAQPAFDGVASLATTDTGKWVCFAVWTENGAFVARLVSDDMLVFPDSVRLLLLAIVFVTLYLTVFLLFNVKHDDMVVIKDRIRRFQLAFITEYMDKQADGNVQALPADIANRKASLNTDIKRSLGRRAKKHEKEVDELLERNWDDILGALGAKPTQALAAPLAPIAPVADTAELKRMLEEVLSSGNVHVQATVAPTARATMPVAESIEKVEEVAEAEPIEEVEEIAEAEPLEEVEELTEAETVEDVEEIAETEPVENVEELAEIEPLEDVEEIAEADAVEEAEELAEIEPLEDVEEIAETEMVEEVEEVAEADAVEDVEELAEIEPLEEIEELADSESVEEIEEVAELEPIAEVDELADDAPAAPNEPETEEVADAPAPVSQNAAVAAFLEQMRKPDKVNFVDLGDIMTTESAREERSDFTETLGFSSPTTIHGLNKDFIADSFKVSALDFSDLDALDPQEAQNGMLAADDEPDAEPLDDDWAEPPFVPLATEMNQKEEIEEVPVLESSDKKSAFAFSSFGRNDTPVTELLSADDEDGAPFEAGEAEECADEPIPLAPAAPTEAIVEDADGTYRIADQLPQGTAALDARFKELVDSVLG